MTTTGWTEVNCGCCNGIAWGGEEPRTCRDCGGNGVLWRSPKGRLALYPGGPFRGVAVDAGRVPAPGDAMNPQTRTR